MKEVVNKVRQVSVRALTRNVVSALENSALQIEARSEQFSNVELPPVREEIRAIAERFMTNLNAYFDALNGMTTKEEDFSEYGNLSLADHDYLEAMIAMEGMMNHARNSDIQQYISFTTRLNSVFDNLNIDETNNPLDPEQIGDCFNEAVRPLGLKAHYLLTIYREFNKAVFHNLESVLSETNDVLIDLGIMPNLDVKARNRELTKQRRATERPTTDAETRAFSEGQEPAHTATNSNSAEPSGAQPSNKSEITRKLVEKADQAKPEQSNGEMFAMMQTLVRGLADQKKGKSLLPVTIPVAASNTSIESADLHAENESLMQQQAHLMSTLNSIQSRLQLGDTSDTSFADAGGNYNESISSILNLSSESGDLGFIDSKSSDVMNLVTLLYKAIWSDGSLPLVMKELIGRTQISIMKIALSDTDFFDDEQHPGRVILNEFAMAGISWTEKELLETDPIFTKVRDLVELLLAEEKVDSNFLQNLIYELRSFKNKFSRSDPALEQRLREKNDHNERLEDVHEYVRQKVGERVLRDDLDPFIRSLLDTHFHDFLVKLVLKEGPGGSSWNPVMSTVDVLLWTVKTAKLPGDKSRFEKINPRLLGNLEKALEIGGASKSKRTKVLRQLKQVQQYSFHMAEMPAGNLPPTHNETAAQSTNTQPLRRRKVPSPLPRGDSHLRQVDKLPIGIWLEFQGAAGVSVRCTLAAKIDSIDKLFFVNSKGVKVVELTRMRLARELKAGSVKIISEGSLVDRAMETVISTLRELTDDQEPHAAST